MLAAAVLVAGCGGDDDSSTDEGRTARTDEAPKTSPRDEPRQQDTDPPPATEPEAEAEAAPEGGGSPEDQPGGAGDEIPARSQALVTGRDGQLTPRRVRVPPFISVRVELRSADGGEYTLRGGGKTLTAGGRTGSITADFDGLRPGRTLVLAGPQGRVVVEASAEPGP